ncbi:hypothetical protein KESI111651_06310 [Kerstersia similis]
MPLGWPEALAGPVGIGGPTLQMQYSWQNRTTIRYA